MTDAMAWFDTMGGPAAEGPLRLLVVDDDAVDRLAVRRALSKSALAAAEIQEAADATTALAALTADGGAPEFDCALLDYDLAGATGMEVLRELQRRGSRVPVVMLTGQSDPLTAAASIKAGATEFLTKNLLGPERLEQVIRAAIRVGQAERDAEETRQRLGITLGSIADAVITVDRGGRIVYLNPAAQELTGWPASEAVGQPFENVAYVLAVDGGTERLHHDLLQQRVAQVTSGEGAGERADMTLVARDGRQLYVDVIVRQLRDAAGRPAGAVMALRDITERKRAEAALAEANRRLKEQAEALELQVKESESLAAELEQANEHLEEANLEAEAARTETETLSHIGSTLASELNVERIVQTVTDAATTLTGAQFGAFFYNVVDSQGEKLTLYTLSGAPKEAFENFGHPRPTPVFAPTFYATAIVRSDDITADPRYGQMGPHYGMPPGHLPVRSYLAVPVMSRSGEVIGGLFFGHKDVGVFGDRSERLAIGIASWAAVAMDNARLYEAEQRARAEAEQANRTKSDFLANMSHELRTPLNAIGGYAELLSEGIRGPMTPPQLADLDRIKRNQRYLLSLINDILNFAKLEAGRVRFALRDVSMNDALGELEALVAPQLEQKQIRYEYRCCDQRYTAFVDPERLQQILLNLLSNAIKFTAPGGEVLVECAATRDQMQVRVSDTGVGIPPDKLEQIFEPFVQLDRGQPIGNAGTGLGLAISRDLARAMGGGLTAESTMNVGSTFMLSLPRRRASAGQPAAPAPPLPAE
jgi:PAS domain S-box-containing protein